MFGGLFGKNANTNYDSLSTAEITTRIATKEAKATEIRTLLQRAEGTPEAREQARQWQLKMEKSAEEARNKFDMTLVSKIEAEMAEARKRATRIEKHTGKMNEELLGLEEEIELLTRALDKKQKPRG